MRKKALIYHASVVLQSMVLFLFFGMILASRTFVDDQESSCEFNESTYSQAIATHLVTEMNERERLEMLGLYVTNNVTTAGCLQTSSYHISQIEDRKYEREPSITLRPASAHARWMAQQKNSVLSWPVDSALFWISSYFGPRTIRGRKGFHWGIDMAAARGTPVFAAADGSVKEAHYASGYGNYILLVHPDGYKTRYAHLSRIRVKRGQRVRSGQLIGNVGATGKVAKSKWGTSASHLHFEVYNKGKRVNPFYFLA